MATRGRRGLALSGRFRARRHRAPGRRVAVAWLAGAFITLALAPVGVPVRGASVATYLDVGPESASGVSGSTFNLTATVYDQDGNVFNGPGTSTHVRFYFMAGSPNIFWYACQACGTVRARPSPS